MNFTNELEGMHVKVLNEAGYAEAMLGLSLNKNKNPEDMPRVAENLGPMDLGHNKFLESIVIWIDIRLSRDLWSEFDTYRHLSKQSESTMHTIDKRPLLSTDFVNGDIPKEHLAELNSLIKSKAPVHQIKRRLPEGFLQRRVVRADYKSIRSMIMQRYNHQHPAWPQICLALYSQLEHSSLLGVGDNLDYLMKHHG